jgi:hypothetical protein
VSRSTPDRRRRSRHQPPEPTVRLEGDRLVVEGPRIADVLAVVHQHLGAGATLLRTDRSIVGGIAGFFGREHFTVEADASALVAAAPVSADAPADLEHSAEPDGPVSGDDFAAHLARALEAVDAAEPEELVEALGPSDEELATRLQDLLVEDPPPELTSTGLTSTGLTSTEHASTVEPVDAGPADAAGAGEPDPGPVEPLLRRPTSELDARLAFLLLAAPELDPCELAGRVDELRTSPPEAIERGVVAVVGERDEAMAVAGRLCAEDGGSPDDVVVVAPDAPDGHPAWMWVGSPEEAANRRDRWHRRPGRTIVAVLLPPGDDARRWARAVLDALAPAEVRLAAPAWRAADEVIARRLHDLAPVDGIEVVGHADPATALGLLGSEVPVLTLDGEPASAERWAVLLRAAAGAVGTPDPTGGTGGTGGDEAATVSSGAADRALR